MDMREILQSLDNVSTKPVEGADSMAKFLRVVKEADLNKSIDEAVEYLPVDPDVSTQLRTQGQASIEADRPKQQADAFIRYSSGMYDSSTLPKTIVIKPGVTLPVKFNPIKNMDSDVLANAVAANKLLPLDLQYSSAELSQIVGQNVMQETEAPLPAVMPVKVPPIPQLPAQDGELGGGITVTTNADGTRTYSYGRGMFTYDAQGKAITYASPKMMGLGQSINLANNQTTQTYNNGPIATSQRVDANGKPLQTKINYDIGTAKLGYDNDHVSGIRSTEYQPGPDTPEDLLSPKDMYARGNKDREATYNRAMAQVNSTPVQENSLSKFLSIVRKNDVSILNEGANPHKVTLPVQMAMQHYQQPSEKTAPRTRLIDKYFTEAEATILQKKQEEKMLLKQYAQVIAERVLMKENFNPNKGSKK